MVAPKHKNSCLGRHEFYNFGRLVLGHYMYYYSLSLSDVCLEVDTKIFEKNNAFLLCDLFGHAPVQELLHRGVMKFTTLVDPSMVIFTMHLVCLNHTPILPPFGVVAMKFTISFFPYPQNATYQIW